ncbi:MAG TPA: hypothetical protein VHK89_05025 [Actinomycetota bacterium]|nr:hypothetical protein [Actinomycetota bacterium]
MSGPIVSPLAFAAGMAIVLGTAGSLIRTLVLPRGLASRLSVLVGRSVVRRSFLLAARVADSYETKDRILAASAPMALLSVLLAWLTLFVIGYSLMFWAVVDVTLPDALREVGSSTFTLGFTTTESYAATVIDFVAAGTGLVAIALEIAYLPVIYSAFNRRETLVTMLQSRAGSPAWGPEILARHQMVNIVDSLRELYNEWEAWAADVAESHANYPVLVWFRSPHPLRSWIVGLLAVMDSAALYLALSPSRAPSEARLCLRMGFNCLRDIAEAVGIPFDVDPFPEDPIELTFEEFAAGVRRAEEVGFPLERTPEEAWVHFRGWRVNYEAIAYRIADAVVAPPGPWSGRRAFLPDMAIAPQRPPNRRPEDPEDEGRPRGHRGF